MSRTMWSALLSTHFSSLAEIPITSDQVQQLIVVLICAVIVGGLGSIKAVLDIGRFFKGDPPSDQRFASKAELAATHREIAPVEMRITANLDEHKEAAKTERREFRENLKEIFDRMDAMNRSLGRIEGNLK